MRFLSLLITLLLAMTVPVVWSGCSEEKAATSGVRGAETVTPCPDEVTYRKVAKPFFDEFCRTCHSESVEDDTPTVPHTFDSEADVKSLGAHIHEAIETETMPPTAEDLPRPTYRERKAVLEWLECSGATDSEADEDHAHEE